VEVLHKILGAPINTDEDEDGPFIHPGGKELYFCSKGHKNNGRFLIFSFRKYQKMKMAQPNGQNRLTLVFPINTTDDDVFFCNFN
jgi:hypothetical protein